MAAKPVAQTAWFSQATPAVPAITNVSFGASLNTIQLTQANTVATVNTNDASHVTPLGKDGDADLFRIVNPASLTFTPMTPPSGGSGEGEGAGSSLVTNSLAASHVTFVSPSLSSVSNVDGTAPLALPTVSSPRSTTLSLADFTSRAVASPATQKLVDAAMSATADDAQRWTDSLSGDSLLLHQPQENAATDLVLANGLWHNH